MSGLEFVHPERVHLFWLAVLLAALQGGRPQPLALGHLRHPERGRTLAAAAEGLGPAAIALCRIDTVLRPLRRSLARPKSSLDRGKKETCGHAAAGSETRAERVVHASTVGGVGDPHRARFYAASSRLDSTSAARMDISVM